MSRFVATLVMSVLVVPAMVPTAFASESCEIIVYPSNPPKVYQNCLRPEARPR